MRKSLNLLLAIGALMAFSTAALGQWTPKGNVELIVSAGPGGGNDKTARLLAKLLAERKLVTVPLVVVNKPGAGGVIAQNYLNSFAGSGNHLMITNPAVITNALTGTGTTSFTDLTPVAQLFTESIVLITGGKSSLKSAKDAVAALRKDPQSLSIGVAPSVGAGTHIGIAMAMREAGIDPAKLQIVPYATAGDVMTALMGGHIDLMPSTPINVLPQLENGSVRALALTGRQRLGGKLSNVPTFKELGMNTEFGNWRGIAGPRGMGAEQIAYWDGIMTKLVESAEWQAEVRSQLSEQQFMGSAASRKFLAEENVRLTRVLGDLGLLKR